MNWNYRIIRHTAPKVWFGLHEVFYDDTGKPISYTEKPIDFTADKDEGADDIVTMLRQALSDAEKLPVLDADDLTNN